MDFREFEQLARKAQDFQKEHLPRIIRNILEELGETLLNAVVEEINAQDLIDTGTMINSFARGNEGNVWEWDSGRNAITLEVGSNLGADGKDPDKWGYPRLINDGYEIKKAHFVPGYWNSGGSFIYDRNAKGGFIAKPRKFIGRKYFDIAVEGVEGGMNGLIMKRLEKEMARFFA